MTMLKDDISKKIELRSSEVQELIGHIPGGFMRYGIGLMQALLLIVLMACKFIPYQEKQKLPVKVFPNVPVSDVVASADGIVMRCYVEEGARVACGDTLLALQSGDSLSHVLSSHEGTVRFFRFCIPNEAVAKGQKLMEVLRNDGTKRFAFAVVDSLPPPVDVNALKKIAVTVMNQNLTFTIKRTIEDENARTISVLLQSDQAVDVSREVTAEIEVEADGGSLLDKLIQIDL